MATIVLVSFAVLLIVALLAVRSPYETIRRNTTKLPPGNMGWTVVGAIYSFLRSHQATTVGEFVSYSIKKYAQKFNITLLFDARHIKDLYGCLVHRYGKIFSTSLLGKSTIVSADAEHNRFVLQNNTRLFNSPKAAGSFRKLFGDSGIASSPKIYKQMRVVLLSLLNSTKIHTRRLGDSLMEGWPSDS